MRRLGLVVVSVLSLVLGLLAVVPVAVVPAAVAAEDEPVSDVAVDPLVVPVVALRADDVPDAESNVAPSVALPDRLADLPGESVGEAVVDGSWSEVPGMPVEVQVDQDPPAPGPGVSGGDASRSAGPTSRAEDDSSSVSQGAGVEVVLERPTDLAAGVLALEVVADGADVAAPRAGSDSDPGPGSGRVAAVGVDVRVSYAEFEQVFGAHWSQRVEVWAYPRCFLSTPQVAGCAERVAVASSNRAVVDEVVFTTIDPVFAGEGEAASAEGRSPGSLEGATAQRGAAAGEAAAVDEGGVVFLLAAGEGSYAASPLRTATQWQVGTGSGDFSYSYPFGLPAARAGATPSLSLNYSSGVVDGMAEGNGQVSMVGVGWSDLSVGSITRSFMSCEDDEDEDPGTSVFADRGDLCWRTAASGTEVEGMGAGQLVDEVSLSLNGRSSRLRLLYRNVEDQSLAFITDEYRLYDDPGWKVLHRRQATGSGSGLADNDDERWTVLSPDGTQHLFGSRPASSSTWTVPVFGNDTGEPCKSGTVAGSVCQQAWQWNLDRVVDPHGNEIVYTYSTEPNHYARYDGVGNPTVNAQYVRAGALSKIEYGMWSDPTDAAFSAGNPRQVVDITTTDRCINRVADSPTACGSIGLSPQQWPDTPGTLICGSSGSCPNDAPAFFSTRRYHQVQTTTMRGAGVGVTTPVATYTLRHRFPDPDALDPDVTVNGDPAVNGEEEADLWLLSVQVVGQAGGESTPLPHVFFDGEALASRVVPVGDDAATRFRMFAVRNEMGGRTEVDYGHEETRECTEGYVTGLDRWASTKECYAAKNPNAAGFEWFHRYVVVSSAATDDSLRYRVGSIGASSNLGKSQVTEYQYVGAPAWRFNASRVVLDGQESWADWRGYETTLIRVRKVDIQTPATNGDSHSLSRVVRFRGMNRSKSNGAGVQYTDVRLATVEDENGPATGDPGPLDERWLNGLVAETELKYPDNTGATNAGDLIRRDYTSYSAWTLQDGLNLTLAKRVYTEYTNTTTRLTSGPTPTLRAHRVQYETFDGGAEHRGLLAGVVRSTWDQGAASDVGDDICTIVDYETNESNRTTETTGTSPSRWHYAQDLSSVYDDDCTSAGGVGSGPVVRSMEMFYDDQETTPTNALLRGRLTATHTRTDATNGIETEADYDLYGRVTETRDGEGNRVLTEFNPAGTPSGAGPLDVLERTRVTQVQGALDTDPSADGPPDLVTIAEVSPSTGTPTKVTDANAKITQMTYDGLGRLRKVYLPTNAAAFPLGFPSIEHTYTLTLRTDPNEAFGTVDQPSRVRTTTLKDKSVGGNPVVLLDSYAFFDGWGRQIETQTPSPTTGRRLVTSTAYDERGLVQFSAAPYSATGTFDTVVNPNPTTLPRYQLTGYDAASRPVLVQDRTGSEVSPTQGEVYRAQSTEYFGNMTRTVPPSLGATTTFTDVWDRPVRTELSTSPTGTPVTDQVAYTYTAASDLDTMTKPLPGVSGQVTWDYDYDLAGRKTKAVDPDTGITVLGYDNASNTVVSETYAATSTYGQLGALQDRIQSDYDDLNRPTKRRDTTALSAPAATGGRTMAQWFYDTATNGLGRLAAAETSIKSIDTFGPVGGADWHTSKLITGYDAAGRPNGTTTRYPSWLTGETANVTGSSPMAGVLAADANVAHTHTSTYDELGNTLVLSYPATPGLAVTLPVTSTYENTGGRLATTNYASQTLAAATYDAIGQPTSLLTYSNSTADKTTWRRDYTWEPITGRLSSLTVKQRTGTTAGGPHTTNPIELAQWYYQYDTADQPQRITASRQNLVGGGKAIAAWCYDYDGLGRITRGFNGTPAAAVPNGDQTPCAAPTTGTAATVKTATGEIHDLGYTYSADRLATVVSPGTGTPVTTMTYQWGNPEPHQTSTIARTGSATVPAGMPTPGAITYDDQGRATTQPGSGIVPTEYDRQGNPVKTGSTTAGTVYAAYDTDGMRIARRQTEAAGITTTVYLGGLTEISRTGIAAAIGTHHITTPNGTPLASVSIAGWDWEVADAQGAMRIHRPPYTATDPAPKRANYYPYGTPAPTTADPFEPPNMRGYLGKHHDTNGNIRLDHRNYTPNLSILITPDPLLDIADPQNFNPYAYSRNNPITLVDPSGLGACRPNQDFETPCGADTAPTTLGAPTPELAGAPPSDVFVLPAEDVDGSLNSTICAGSTCYSADVRRTDGGYGDGYELDTPIQGASIEELLFIASFASGPGAARAAGRALGSALMRALFSRSSAGWVARAEAISATRLATSGAARIADSGFVNPATIRFSQNSIGANFKKGGSVKSLADDLKSGAVSPASIPQIRIVSRNGSYYSLDNRRLYAFKEAGLPVPYRMASPQEIASESGKFTTTNGGTAVVVRGGN